MNRKEFIKNMGAAVGFAALGLGCSKEATANEASSAGGDAKALASAKNKGDKKMKCAVVYYSWSGNTRFAAETIAKKTGADLFEIKAEKPYNSDFQECCDEAQPECYGKKLRPIKPIEGLDLAKYDLVFVGSPNWWGTMAPPVRTWVAQSKDALKGKTVCLFPDARRRRNATRRERVRGNNRRCGEGPATQGVQRLFDQVERRCA